SQHDGEYPVEDDLLDHHFPGHRLHGEVNDIRRHGREECNRNSEAHALGEPRLRLDAARIDPHECAGEHHVSHDHPRKVFLLVARRAEEAGEMQKYFPWMIVAHVMLSGAFVWIYARGV